jgi:hypothetical protein
MHRCKRHNISSFLYFETMNLRKQVEMVHHTYGRETKSERTHQDSNPGHRLRRPR